MKSRYIFMALFGILGGVTCLIWLNTFSATADETVAIGGITSRNRLEICIANLDGSPTKTDIFEKTHAALNITKTHVSFDKAGLAANGGPTILNGCPNKSTLNTTDWGKDTVTNPGSIHTYVFIASERELSQTSFKHYPRVVGHQQMCDDHVCNSIANALYITPEEVSNQEIFAQALLFGLGLETPQDSIYVPGVTQDNKSR